MPQSDFQKRAFLAAQTAHSAVDRADARILMRIIEVVDERDFESLTQLVQALRREYRNALGPIPRPDDDTAAGLDHGDARQGDAGEQA